jgi:hypothetical protein
MAAGIDGVGSMTSFFVFIYALASGFVLLSMQRNQREQRPSPQVVTLVGWGLFSLSSTLALLLGAAAVAMAMGMNLPVPAGFDATLF